MTQSEVEETIWIKQQPDFFRGRYPRQVLYFVKVNTKGKLETRTKGNVDKCSDLTFTKKYALVNINWVRTKHGTGVHGHPLWTGSMDHFHGPGPWTPCHRPGPWTFFYLYKKVLYQVHGHSKNIWRDSWPMLTIDHKYLVVLTWRTLCLHMCSRKTAKLS